MDWPKTWTAAAGGSSSTSSMSSESMLVRMAVARARLPCLRMMLPSGDVRVRAMARVLASLATRRRGCPSLLPRRPVRVSAPDLGFAPAREGRGAGA